MFRLGSMIRGSKVVIVSFLIFSSFLFATPSAWSQQPLVFENNYFVTGDYVVAGVGLKGQGVNGYAKGTISLPDNYSVPSTGVPAGADIVAAFLYWETVEASQTSFQGQQGYFRGYPIAGVVLGNPSAPVSWSSGGCSGASSGSKTLRAYRADVRAYLPVNADGSVQANGSYEVKLADSGSNGSGTPLTLGASLVIIWRVLDKTNPPTVPLNAILLYDGAYAPTNGSQTMAQTLQGFYQPMQAGATAKLTHIVGGGQSNKYQKVLFGTQSLTPPNTAAFPGAYSGSWDNPTYIVSPYVNASDTSEITTVVPSSSNSGCVSWGAVIMSTTVQDSDNDGLLDVWESNGGYCDAAADSTSCDHSGPYWVALNGANPNHKDAFIQLDYMCSSVNSDGTCAGDNHSPPKASVDAMTAAFAARDITLHFDASHAIPEQSCVDQPNANPPVYCSYPGQPGVVGWKGGYEFIKNQPLNYPDEASCEQNADCVRRFQHGRKDSYHYALFGHAMGVANWSYRAGNLVSVSLAGSTATFTASTPVGLVAGNCLAPNSPPNSRFTVTDAITNPSLNGLYCVTSVSSDTSNGVYRFTAQLSSAVSAPITYTSSTDPNLAVASGQAGSGSGYSDVGGSDSLITLGTWGPDGQTVNVQAGTFMHEFGHSIGLTHGGYYFDNSNNPYAPTAEPNCKSNYQSIMNYMFQLDLLGPDNVLDYSGQQLNALNESSLGTTTLTDQNLLASRFSTTKWYASSPPLGIGSPATHYCDGTPFSKTPGPQMYRIEGSTTDIPWAPLQDINFDAKTTQLRGFNDWANIDLRQIGATGSDVTGAPGSLGFGAGSLGFGAGSLGFGAGSLGFGAGSLGFGAGSLGFGAGSLGFGAGSLGFGAGQGAGEITFVEATAVVRPPRFLTATPKDTRTSHSVTLNWQAPSFGTAASYNLYRGDNLAGWPKSVTSLSYPDGPSGINDCTTYSYVVSDISAATGGQSIPSNSALYAVPCPADGLAAAQTVTNNAPSVTLNWTAAPSNSGEVYGYNIYRNTGSAPGTSDSPMASLIGGGVITYTDSGPFTNHTAYTYSVTAILKDRTGCSGNTYCRESTQINKSITVSFKIPQTITFAPLPDKTWGDADFAVSATASSSLPVSFTASGNCTVSTSTVHIAHAGSCTVTASQVGDDNYYPAPNVDRSFTINKANATITVVGYNTTYDGNPHTASGSAKGAGIYAGDTLNGLNLAPTTHTNAGNYNDTWTFTDPIGNYKDASGTVTDVILKANPIITVTAYSVVYDGNPHTATGTAIGVKGESLAGLNLSGTVHTLVGTYTDAWTFTDVTGNYFNAGGSITDVITKAPSTTQITSVTPSPSILGQLLTVNFKVSPTIVTGSVTVSDVSGARCTGALSAGIGSCVLTLPKIVNGLAVVGNRTLSASYPGDSNFMASSGTYKQQVNYVFTGFYSPLLTAGDTSNSGAFNLSKSVTVKWSLQDSSGTFLGILNANKLYAVGPLPLLSNGSCPLPAQVPLVANSTFPVLVLYSPTAGAKGNSTFRIASSNNQYVFNWDTTTATSAGCYVLELDLDSGQAFRTTLMLR